MKKQSINNLIKIYNNKHSFKNNKRIDNNFKFNKLSLALKRELSLNQQLIHKIVQKRNKINFLTKIKEEEEDKVLL